MKLRICVTLLAALISIPEGSQAQPPTRRYQIDRAALSLFAPPNFYMNVWFTDPLADPNALNESNITINTTPDHALTIASIGRLLGTRKAIQILFNGQPPTDVTDAKVCMSSVSFQDAQGGTHIAENLCYRLELETPSSIASQQQQALDNLKKVPKTSQEKNIFASGFVTSSSTGSEGGISLNLNSDDLGVPGLTALLHLDKATAVGGDPKSFETGVNFRNVLLFGKADLEKIQSDIDAYRSATDPAEAAHALAEIKSLSQRQRLWSAVLIDFAGKLEGQAMDFKVANFVGDGQLQVQSRTQKLFGSTLGFWRFRIIPVGVEGGKNVNTTGEDGQPTPSTPDFVARGKAGGELTLFYENSESTFIFKRIDLTLGTVQRYLFLDEARMSSTSDPVLTISHGYRPWYQAALRIYMVNSPKGKFGFQLKYQNGSLPPTFAVTKAFQFGFLIESSDGEDRRSQ